MKSRCRAVVISGGVPGCSVRHHPARAGWTDIMPNERPVLTAAALRIVFAGTGHEAHA